MDFNLTLIGQTIAMMVFVWFSMKFIWPVLMNIIEKRRKEIADGIAAGEKGQRELADARQGSEAILQEARQKAVQVVDIAHRRSNELVGEAKHVAIAEGERLITAARSEATNEKQRARDALRKEVAVLALAAWNLGWEPARAVAGTGWMPYLFSTLLLDDYDAVRWIAARSVRKDPRWRAFDLDPCAELEEQRNHVRATVLPDWLRDGLEAPDGPGAQHAAVLVRPDGTLDEARFRELYRQRDQRPVRLAE
jgi:F-type H+-transporting ATPase subunit b